MEDTSLTDFFDAGEEVADVNEWGDDADEGPEGPADESDRSTVGPEDRAGDGDTATEAIDADAKATVEPDTDATELAETTVAWSPENTPCPSCGEATAWRYRDGDTLVCPACKSWE